MAVRSRPEVIMQIPFIYQDIINKAGQDYSVPPVIISSVIRRESAWNPNAVGSSGEIGLMQIMPKTAQYLKIGNSFNPEENIRGGAKYLSELYNKYGNWRDALSHYNAGFNLGAGRKYADTVLQYVAETTAKNPSMTPILDAVKRGDDPTKVVAPIPETPVKLGQLLKDWWSGSLATSDLLKAIARDVGLWILGILFIIIGIWRLVNA